MGWLGPDATSVVNPTEVDCWFILLLYSVLCTVESFCFISFLLYLELYVLGDSSWIS